MELSGDWSNDEQANYLSEKIGYNARKKIEQEFMMI